MADKISTAKISFFDLTPIGNVISRFSTDLSMIDGHLRGNLSTCMRNGYENIFMFVTVCLIN